MSQIYEHLFTKAVPDMAFNFRDPVHRLSSIPSLRSGQAVAPFPAMPESFSQRAPLHFLKSPECNFSSQPVFHYQEAPIMIAALLATVLLFVEPPMPIPGPLPAMLYQIKIDGKIGFIDSTGKVIVKPKFAAAGKCAEGLIPVREHGRYGYINTAGRLVIPYLYDYATEFHESYAIVYLNDKPFYIDKQGNHPFKHAYRLTEPFKNGRARVLTYSGNYGIINVEGKLVLDTVYHYIRDLEDRRFVVFAKGDTAKAVHCMGIYDIDGNSLLLPKTGVYIEDFRRGAAMFSTEAKYPDRYDDTATTNLGLLDTNGNIIFKNTYKNKSIKSHFRTNERIIVEIDTILVAGDDRTHSSIFVILNEKGKNAAREVGHGKIYDLGHGIGITKEQDGTTFLTDAGGNILKDISLSSIHDDNESGFKDGFTIVHGKKGDFAIDTNGAVLFPPNYYKLRRTANKNILAYESLIFDPIDHVKNRTGLINIHGSIITPPFITSTNENESSQGVLSAQIADTAIYCNYDGTIIYKYRSNRLEQAIDTLDFDCMHGAHYELLEKRRPKQNSIIVDTIIDSLSHILKPKLVLWASPEQTTKYQEDYRDAEHYQGFKLFLYNNTNKPLLIYSRYLQPFFIMQAKTPSGQWKDIEFTRSSMCGTGTGYHDLKEKSYLTFSAPLYKGEIRTRLRIRCSYKLHREDEKAQILYSNEFEGSVNPAQFWRYADEDRLEYPINFRSTRGGNQ
jgi:hypothetical protein